MLSRQHVRARRAFSSLGGSTSRAQTPEEARAAKGFIIPPERPEIPPRVRYPKSIDATSVPTLADRMNKRPTEVEIVPGTKTHVDGVYLNWAVQRTGCSPFLNAVRNPAHRKAAEELPKYVSAKGKTALYAFEMDEELFFDLEKETKSSIGLSVVYVVDAGVGAGVESSIPVRVLSDDEAFAVALETTVLRGYPNKHPFKDHKPRICVAHAKTPDPSSDGKPYVSVSACSDNSRDVEFTVVCRGAVDVKVVQEGIAKACEKIFESSESAAFVRSSTFNAGSLTIGASKGGADYVVSSRGVVPAFEGVSKAACVGQVEKTKKKKNATIFGAETVLRL